MKSNGGDSIHWFSIISSFIFALIFAVIVFTIFCRSVRSDIEIINNAAFSETSIDDTRWKQISNEVFRAPYRPMIFSACVGTGIQVNTKNKFLVINDVHLHSYFFIIWIFVTAK